MSTTIGFVGFGLIGGSIARALRKKHPDWNMIAASRSQEPLMMAAADGVLNWVCSGVEANFAACDCIFLCTPVESALDYLRQLSGIIKRDCIVTDVGSTKSDILRAVTGTPIEPNFIGGHPMAGSEKTGYANSSDRLLENCWYILAPAPAVSADKLARMEELVRDIGAMPMVLDPARHDLITATVSHLPHVIASSLVNLVHDSDDDEQHMKQIAAGGFKDLTRIASASPDMWQQICETNADNIVQVLELYIASLQRISDQIRSHSRQEIRQLFADSREYRNSFPEQAAGTLKKQYTIYLDVADEVGAITTVAAILSAHQLSIKNIGINNNREFQEGALAIEFYDEASVNKAAQLLRRCLYTVFER